MIHSFLADFGDRLAPMQPFMPSNVATMTPDGQGFLFLVNSQDHDTLRHDQTDLRITLNLPGESLTIPATGGFTLPKNSSAILPFNFDMDGARLKYATAQPLMVVDDNGIPHYFFTVHDGTEPEFAFDPATVKGRSKYADIKPGINSTFKIKSQTGNTVTITTLCHKDALNASKVNGKLLITEATVIPQADGVKLTQLGNNTFDYIVYPSKHGFKPVSVNVDPVTPELKVDKSVPWRMEVTFTDDAHDAPQVNEYFLDIPYTGDVAMAFVDNSMVLDHFWQGMSWRIGLNRFAGKMSEGKPMGFYFRPLRPEAPFLGDLHPHSIPDLTNGPVLEIGDASIIPEYTTTITM